MRGSIRARSRVCLHLDRRFDVLTCLAPFEEGTVPSRVRRRCWVLPASLTLSVAALVGLAPPSAAAPSNSAQAVVAATRATNRAFKGTNRAVDPTPRPAVPGKHVVVISAGQASLSAQIGVDAAVEAAKAIGWQVEVYDAKLNPANYAPLVRQAIAAKVDGIILGAIDCQSVKAPLREARAANIAVIGGGAFDCNDPHGGNAKQGLFSAQINYGPRVKSLGSFAEAYGADQANYIVSKSRNRAKILVLNDPEFTTLYYTNRGFENVIDQSHGSKIVSTLEITTADFTGTQLISKIQAELLRHPEVTGSRARSPTRRRSASFPPSGATTARSTSWAARASSPSWTSSGPGRSPQSTSSRRSGSRGRESTR